MKDNFSEQSHLYFKFRPVYPDALIDFIVSLVKHKDIALDCGTGNGQMAAKLSEHFKKVYATDISENQLKNAIQKPNIEYKVESAEKSSFDDNLFDLINVSQAVHWFNFDNFYAEVNRTIKNEGILALTGYGLTKISTECDGVINDFYHNILNGYWDKERQYIDEEYKTIPFPFEEIKAPPFCITCEYSFEQLIGYLNTWSAVGHYKKQNNSNPLDLIYTELKEAWGKDEKKKIIFPVISRIGRITG